MGVVAARGAGGPRDPEIDKARRQIQTGIVSALQSNGARARRLADYELFTGDATGLNGELGRYLAVTKDDVKRVVTQYLGPTRRSIVETYPNEPAGAEKAQSPRAGEPKGASAKPSSGESAPAAKKPGAKAGKTKKTSARKK